MEHKTSAAISDFARLEYARPDQRDHGRSAILSLAGGLSSVACWFVAYFIGGESLAIFALLSIPFCAIAGIGFGIRALWNRSHRAMAVCGTIISAGSGLAFGVGLIQLLKNGMC